ncbi:MAG: RagB/SusD family nutrient uptake outer membrane protein [Cytophagales bacterium]|nr:MAG: RagB/SusD family nutrient uptake outer membrane protein [Cytophagales bacterium]TAF60680.1 MAG: RagB/SusD family nutrient uptake outer membrane protein [Cytophagales bacterium]
MKATKKLRRWTLGAVAALMLGSCDILEQPVVNQVLDVEALSNGEQAIYAGRGLMNSLQGGGMYGQQYITMTGTLSDEMRHSGSFLENQQFDLNEVQANNFAIPGIYGSIFSVAYQANIMLERVPLIPADKITEDEITLVTGQAYFARGLAFLQGVSLWGDFCMPLTSDFDANLIITRSPKAEVLAQVIKDFQEAEKRLPAIARREDRVMPSSTAAKALLSRVYLMTGQYAEAERYATEVIALFDPLDKNSGGRYDYDFESLWVAENGTSNESIFEIAFSAIDGNSLAFFMERASAGGRYEFAPAPEILTLLRNKGGVRLGSSVRGSGTTAVVRKYRDIQNGADRVKVVRLAEMYLNRAEARAQLANRSGAVEDLLTVRRRAQASTLVSGTDDILQLIFEERAVEFAFEGHRWYDLQRSGTIGDVMGSVNPDTWQETDALLPIPERELQLNPGMIQNPGY